MSVLIDSIGGARARRAITVFLIALAANGAQARAESNTSWMRFPGQHIETSATSTQAYDRSFVREWEANPPKGFPTLSPANLDAMKVAIRRYQDIVRRGGWTSVPEANLQAGMTGPAVAALTERLLASGDLRQEPTSAQYFDLALEKAVKRFQASNGLTPTGAVDKRTVAALNVPAAVRLKQLQSNLGRVQEFARSSGKRYILVNIPAAHVEIVEGDRVVSRHSGVVGKIDRQTPILRTTIHEMNFNPVWTLPPTVIEQDLVPKGLEMQRRGQDVLAKYGIDAYDSTGRKLASNKIDWSSPIVRGLVYRQQPGKDNPLGFLKINFHNTHSVYMHSTPSESLFGRNFRAASSGCVRVQGIDQVAAWLLEDNGWGLERVERMRETGERQDVKLKKPVPLYFAYITAWATEDGVVNFRRDLYQKDGVGATAAAY